MSLLGLGDSKKSATSKYAMALLLGVLAPCVSYPQSNIGAFENYDPHIRQRTLIEAVDGLSAFGEKVDLASGATSFYVTAVDVAGNNDLEVALRYKYVRNRDWLHAGASWVWERDDPYITGDFGKSEGWVLGNGSVPSASRTNARCSRPTGYSTPPVLLNEDSRYAEFYPQEYWSGYRLVLPRGDGAVLNPLPGANPPVATPSSGGPYKWITNRSWFFSCIPLKNGPGEGFLALAPDGTKYFFDDYRLGPQLPNIDKYNWAGQDVSLERQEIRIYASRIEDKFGNYIEGLAASDGRSITIGGSQTALTAMTGGRVWTVSIGNPFVITNPDQSKWSLSSNWQLSPASSGYSGPGEFCLPSNPPIATSGTGSVTVSLPAGASALYQFAPRLAGYSYVPLKCSTPEGANGTYIVDPSRVTEVSLTKKTVTGAGLLTSWTGFSYGPPNDCYGGSGSHQTTCQAASPTTTTTTVSKSDGSIATYTFGNRYMADQGLLLRVETKQGTSAPLSVITQEWQVLDGLGSTGLGLYSRAGSMSSIKRTILSRRANTQQGRRFTWEVASDCGVDGLSICLDSHARPIKVIKSSMASP